MRRVVLSALLLALFLSGRPASADLDCKLLRAEATRYIVTARNAHKLMLWHFQGVPDEELEEAWIVWWQWKADPVSLLTADDRVLWDREWIQRYAVVLDALRAC